MRSSPLRSFFILALLGMALLTIALVVRSGMLARTLPGRPLNTAMREALDNASPQLSRDDARAIIRGYPTARILPSGLRSLERRPGAGPATPRIGGEVQVHTASRLLDGTALENSYATGQPQRFRVGIGEMIAGWDEAFLAMHKGEKRTLIIPYWLAYGPVGKPPKIPARATIISEVELLEFR